MCSLCQTENKSFTILYETPNNCLIHFALNHPRKFKTFSHLCHVIYVIKRIILDFSVCFGHVGKFFNSTLMLETHKRTCNQSLCAIQRLCNHGSFHQCYRHVHKTFCPRLLSLNPLHALHLWCMLIFTVSRYLL